MDERALCGALSFLLRFCMLELGRVCVDVDMINDLRINCSFIATG